MGARKPLSPDHERALDIWLEHRLDPKWIRFTQENIRRILQCKERDGHLYNFAPLRPYAKEHNRVLRCKRWENLRKEAFEKYGRRCHCCGATKKLTIDNIKPKSKYPELVFDIDNLQVLCWPCNKAKSNLHTTDYRGSLNGSRFH